MDRYGSNSKVILLRQPRLVARRVPLSRKVRSVRDLEKIVLSSRGRVYKVGFG